MDRVMILGGGYAGVAVARRLATRSDLQVTLLDRRPAHELLTRLPDLLGREVTPDRLRLPYTQILPPRVRVLQCDVRAISPGDLAVETDAGPIVADWLVVTLGSVLSSGGVPGVREHAITMRSVEDALTLRQRVDRLVVTKGMARVAIVGAGYTGTEVAGELLAWRLPSSSRPARVSVSLIAEDDRLLPQGNARLAAIAERELRGAGANFALSQRVKEIVPGLVVLESGAIVDADLTVWATSAVAPPSVAGAGWEHEPDGRIRADIWLRAAGAERVFVVGDVAAVSDVVHGGLVPSSAQVAVQEGARVAENLLAAMEGRPLREFRPRMLGEALKLGDNGAAEVLGVVVTGRKALAVKQAALARYLLSLGGRRLLASYGSGA